VDKIFDLLLEKYQNVLGELQIGYSINNCNISELMHLLHVLHLVSYTGSSDDVLQILAYYE